MRKWVHAECAEWRHAATDEHMTNIRYGSERTTQFYLLHRPGLHVAKIALVLGIEMDCVVIEKC